MIVLRHENFKREFLCAKFSFFLEMKLQVFMIQLMIVISILTIAANASGIANILAVFDFLPAAEYNQLKHKIIQIIHKRSPSSRHIYQQARSIVSEISDAYSMVVSHAHRNGHLRKRTTDIVAAKVAKHQYGHSNSRGGSQPPKELHNIPHLAQRYGFFDIFKLKPLRKIKI